MDSLDSTLMQHLIQKLRSEMLAVWPSAPLSLKLNPILSREQFYAAACVPPHAMAWDYRFNFIQSEQVLRRELADSMPTMLRMLGSNSSRDRLLLGYGEVYQRRQGEDFKAHHEVEVWRLANQDISLDCLDELLKILGRVLPLPVRMRTRSCKKAYMVYGLYIEIYYQRIWRRIGHCGLINPMLLIEHGWDSAAANGLVLNMDLSFCMDLWVESRARTVADEGEGILRLENEKI